jgi:hypothetical protein
MCAAPYQPKKDFADSDPPLLLLSDTAFSPLLFHPAPPEKTKNILQHAPCSRALSFYMDVKMHQLENTVEW